MEFEIDLSRYLLALVRRWHWILIAAIVCAVAAALVSFVQQSTYVATASVFFRPTRSQVQMDSRFITDETVDIASQRATLLTLAKSPSIGALLPKETLSQLGLDGESTTTLTERINANASGDLIEISASGETPEQARDLADAWAKEFVAHVNQLYAQTSLTINNEQVKSQYDVAQKAYEQFIGSNQIGELNQRIAATQRVITQTLQADQSRYEAYLARVNQLDLVLRDAETLRRQFTESSAPSLGDSIALLTLRARVNSATMQGDTSESPVQLQIDLPTAIERGENITLQDIDLLIKTLRKDIEETRTAAMTLAEGIVADGETTDSDASEQNRSKYLAQLSALLQEREVEEGRRLMLEQERDVALNALQVVQSKAAEQQIAAVQPDVEVRMAGAVILPDSPDNTSIVILTIVGAGSGVMLGLLLVIVLEIWRSLRSRSRDVTPGGHGTAVGSTVKQP